MTDRLYKNNKVPGLLAFEDHAFLMRDDLRATRLSLEFSRAEVTLAERQIKSTVVVFGSARARPRRSSPSRPRRDSVSTKMKVPAEYLADWYDEARKFGRIVSERGGALAPIEGMHENVITTGGGPGLMEAANQGAFDAGAPTIGFNIALLTEQAPNPYITPELSFHFHYFAVRKMHFAMRANALAVFPGGFGTLDELFEILTLKQTRKVGGMPVVLFCREFWDRIINFKALAEYGTISPDDLKLFAFADSAEEGWEAMLERGLTLSTPLREI
jgi:hypothetical protein